MKIWGNVSEAGLPNERDERLWYGVPRRGSLDIKNTSMSRNGNVILLPMCQILTSDH